jgi:hypothetical protein
MVSSRGARSRALDLASTSPFSQPRERQLRDKAPLASSHYLLWIFEPPEDRFPSGSTRPSQADELALRPLFDGGGAVRWGEVRGAHLGNLQGRTRRDELNGHVTQASRKGVEKSRGDIGAPRPFLAVR